MNQLESNDGARQEAGYIISPIAACAPNEERLHPAASRSRRISDYFNLSIPLIQFPFLFFLLVSEGFPDFSLGQLSLFFSLNDGDVFITFRYSTLSMGFILY